MNVLRFYYLIRVLTNTQVVVIEPDPTWTWLLDNGYVENAGSSSIKLTDIGTAFVLERFQKILDLP